MRAERPALVRHRRNSDLYHGGGGRLAEGARWNYRLRRLRTGGGMMRRAACKLLCRCFFGQDEQGINGFVQQFFTGEFRGVVIGILHQG